MLEDWIENVEDLMGEDDDGDECPLLEEFDDDSGEGSLLDRIDSYLARVGPSKEIVDELAKLVIDSTIRRTVGVIVLTWSEDTITFQAQNSLQKVENVNENKVRFYCRIFGEMLKLTKWKMPHLRGSKQDTVGYSEYLKGLSVHKKAGKLERDSCPLQGERIPL